jgi:hypothetical protein
MHLHGTVPVTNSAAAAYQAVAVAAVWNQLGTNDADVLSSQTGKVFVARTPEAFTYDADGNLLTDGRYTTCMRCKLEGEAVPSRKRFFSAIDIRHLSLRRHARWW